MNRSCIKNRNVRIVRARKVPNFVRNRERSFMIVFKESYPRERIFRPVRNQMKEVRMYTKPKPPSQKH